MDHLPVPKNPAQSPPRVQYYCLEVYDRGDFVTYPERQGWKTEELFTRGEPESGGGRGRIPTAAFLQQWLFFGLLHAVFGDDVNFQDYIDVDGNGSKFVHTRNLLGDAEKLLTKRDSGLILEKDMPLLDRSLHTAYRAYHFVKALSGAPLDPYFVLSLSLLGRLMVNLRQALFGTDDLNSATWIPPVAATTVAGFQQYFPGHRMNILEYEMAKEGWCPRAVGILQRSVGLECQYFASLLRNLQKGRNNHTECTDKQCLASQIEKSTYQTVHTTPGCSCRFQGVDSADVAKILENGGLPLVVWNREKKGIDLIAGSFDSRYVAISHVWSDGLGNPKENAMPQCQLEALGRMVRSLYPDEAEEIPFWMDTLCCPAIRSEGKKTAIRKMRETYACASKCLVLDNTLRSIETAGRSIRELALYILSSNWAARLWTLQEGALPDVLIFQFSDATFEAETILDAAESPDSDLRGGWGGASDLYSMYTAIRGPDTCSGALDKAPFFTLGESATALGKRATSVREDEALCLSSLMAIDPGTILNVERPDRMRQFWSQLTRVSESWMYFRHARLDAVGFRWAPQSLLGSGNIMPYNDEGATITEKGLLVNAYSLALQSLQLPLQHPIADHLFIRGADENAEFKEFNLSKKSQSPDPKDAQRFSIPEGAFSSVAVLMTDKISGSRMWGGTEFVMVFVTGVRDGVTYARRGDSGNLFEVDHPALQGTKLQRYHDGRRESLLAPKTNNVSKEGENYLLDTEYAAVVGDWSTEKSQWCID